MTRALASPVFPGIVFGRTLSLGANCEPAHHLRSNGRLQQGLFDWLVTPLDALERVMADDGAQLGTEFIAVQDGTSVRCGAYDVLYHHEFPRGEGNSVTFNAAVLERCRSKLHHKWQRFTESCEGDEPVLFFRFGAQSDLPWDRIKPARDPALISDLNRLVNSIERRFPTLIFRLLLILPLPPHGEAAINPDALEPLDTRIAIEKMATTAGGPWLTADRDWSDLLARVRFGSAPAAGALNETLYWSGEIDDIRDGIEPRADIDHGAADGKEITFPQIGAARHTAKFSDFAPQLEAEVRHGDLDQSLEHIGLAIAFGCEPLEAAVNLGRDLWKDHKSHHATIAFAIAFDAGVREPTFLRDHLGLLSGETRYEEVLSTTAMLAPTDERQRIDVLMYSGHARLALSHDRQGAIELASQREVSSAWLNTDAVLARIKAHLDERRPFSLIRLGDGEARFLIAAHRDLCPEISDAEASAIGSVVWGNWFGEAWSDTDPGTIAALASAYESAIAHADVVGASGAARLRQDTGHYGYLAVQERWLREIGVANEEIRWTSAFIHYDLHRATPFLEELLQGRDVVGLISPHPDLATALQARFTIGEVISHVIPGEGRLPNAAQNRNFGSHFPTFYEALLAGLEVPRPGCLFLVAGGLLGKLYCARLKALGGVALDIGAIVDAWMGYDTRPGQLVDVKPLDEDLSLARLAEDAVNSPFEPDVVAARTIACLSIGKTSSMALAAALRDAGCEGVEHLHYLGPQALKMKRCDPEPMLDLAERIAGHIDDPQHAFSFVTCVRDPIARALSQAFYNAARHKERTGEDIIRDADAVVDWQERKFAGELSTLWFDDTYKMTFGFDFRTAPFDHDRRSLRYETPRLKVLVLRQEDPSALKELELGWLIGRESVPLPVVNDAASQGYEADYRAFIDDFVAPARWLETFYDTDVARHFYTLAEREAFQAKWSMPRSSKARREILASVPVPEDTVDGIAAEDPASVLAERDSLRTELAEIKRKQEQGFSVDFADFSYRPRERDWSGLRGAKAISDRFAADEEAYFRLLERICAFDPRFREIPVLATPDRPHWENWWLPGLDAAVLYGLVAIEAPRVFLEVGSGNSTRFVRQAIIDNGLSTKIVSIDPNPTADIDALCDEVIRQRCEDVPSEIFANLDERDMLFVDNSHRSFQNSDVTVFFTEVLPSLAPGLLYGLHDVFLPFDYPQSWTNRFYNEQYLMMAYLLGGADGDQVILPIHHMSRDRAFAPLRNHLFAGTKHLDWLPSSFWMRRGRR